MIKDLVSDTYSEVGGDWLICGVDLVKTSIRTGDIMYTKRPVHASTSSHMIQSQIQSTIRHRLVMKDVQPPDFGDSSPGPASFGEVPN
jgi:hypothetical protein